MSTVHTSAASLYRAILDAASTSWEDSEAVTLEAVRPGDPDEDASNYCTAEFRGPWLDVKRAMLLEVPMHGPVRPYPAPATFAFQSNGARASFKIKGNRTRLLAMAEQVRKHWSLYGGGPAPADLAKPKAAKRAVTWPASIVKVWLQQFEDKDYAGAMLTGERLDAVFYPGAKGCAFILAAPIQVEGLPEGVCSARRNDGKWVVACMQSGRAIESRGYGSRKTAEESALSEVARVGLDKLTAALERNRADAVDHDEARAAWCKACNIEDPREPAPAPQPAPESEEGAESADDWAARMVAQVSEPAEHAEVAQPAPVAQLQLTAWQAAAARADVPAPENESEAASLAEACLARFGAQDCASCEHLPAFPAWLSETLSLMRGAANKRARAIVYGVHCKTAAVARKIAPDALANGARLRRSVNEAGFNAASMALRRSVAQAVRAARRGPVARDVAPDADEVARIVGVMAGKPDAAADLRARADNMRAGVRQGMQWPGAVQDAAADLTMTRARVYDAAADAIDARPGPDAAPVAPVAHAAPPVVQAAGPVVAPSADAAPLEFVSRWTGSRCNGLSAVTAKVECARRQRDEPGFVFKVAPCMGEGLAPWQAAALRGKFEVQRWRVAPQSLPPHTFEAALIGADSQRLESFTYTCAGPGLASADIKGANDRLQAMATARGLRVVMQGFSDGGAKAWAEPKAQPWAPSPAPALAAAPAPSAPPVGVSAPHVTVSTDPDAAMMRKAAERAQVLADGIKAAAGDDPATMARMLRRESARVKAAALGMPARIAASYRATADMLEYAAELHADALAREVPDMAREAQPGMSVQATARRPVMARRSPLAQPWRTGPATARQGRAAPRMRPQAAAPPVWVCAAPVGESGLSLQ